MGLLALGGLLFAIFSIRHDHFASSGNIQALTLAASSVALAAVGSMILVVAGKVDLSIGSQYALNSVVTALVVRETQNAAMGIVVALSLGAVLGLVNGILVQLLSISPLIVTLGTLGIYRGLAYVVSEGMPIFGFPTSFTQIGATRLAGIPSPVVAAVVVFSLGSIYLLRTVGGLRLYALGGNEEATARVGVRTRRMILTAFSVNGAVIGLVALLAVSRLGSGSPQVGVAFELDVLTAVILGGFAFAGGSGHPLGVVAGVLTIGILNAGLIFEGLADYYQQIAKGALLLLALFADQILVRIRATRLTKTAPAETELGQESINRSKIHRERHLGEELLNARGIDVKFGNVHALKDAGLVVRAGEVVCLLGDNGAGKSTLIKALSGVIRPDSGVMTVAGRDVAFASPQGARSAGIETVFQDLALCPNLGVAHNLVLGAEPVRRFGGIKFRDDRQAARTAHDRLARLNVPVTDLNRPIQSFSGGQQQSVSIARALKGDVKVVILDEPTAALGVSQTAQVLRLVSDIAAAGHAVILITHDVEEVLSVADRVVVMRLGRVIHDGLAAELSPLGLIQLMAGITPARDGVGRTSNSPQSLAGAAGGNA